MTILDKDRKEHDEVFGSKQQTDSVFMLCVYLQTVVEGKVLMALSCGEKQVARSLGVGSFVARDLSILQSRRVQVLPDPEELPTGL